MNERTTFTCAICDWQWQCLVPKDEKETKKAIKANKDGPYCDLCQPLIMALRVGRHRGMEFWQIMNRFEGVRYHEDG